MAAGSYRLAGAGAAGRCTIAPLMTTAALLSRSRRSGVALRRVLTWNPWIKRSGKRMLAYLVRLMARPRAVTLPKRPAHLDPDAILARTDELNEAAERYYAEYPEPEFILGKPFVEESYFPKRLFDLGVLFHALRLAPGDVVLELGAGTCWVSHFLNRYGCKTVSVDVSKTALALGREYFRRDSHTRWDLEPDFLVYDGRRLPLADRSCDRIVINDAFHHLPNPQEVLHEMARVLVDGGIVAMSEPGPGHADSQESIREVETTGVLENEIVLDELDEMARRSGFDGASLLPLSLDGVHEVPVSVLGQAAESEVMVERWLSLHAGPRYIVLHKGAWVPTSRRAEGLAAEIEVVAPRAPWRAAPGESLSLRVRVRNRGTARWLATAEERKGWTRLGVHLYRDGGGFPGEVVDFDWLRVSLGPDLDPGEERVLDVTLPAIEAAGDYRLVFDLVAEQVLWLAQRGSRTADGALHVAGR